MALMGDYIYSWEVRGEILANLIDFDPNKN